ncbi:MAG: tRNA adenosine(34) deaminase TadA [Candidatus Kapaibacteriales bacterium]
MTKNEISKYMRLAISEAETAYNNNEIPVGAVLVSPMKEIFTSHNTGNSDSSPISHAELKVIQYATGKERYLTGWSLFVTLEPCPMCAGAIWLSRISEVYFGAYDIKAGACGSVINVLPNDDLNHRPLIFGGILEDECSLILKEFFERKR